MLVTHFENFNFFFMEMLYGLNLNRRQPSLSLVTQSDFYCIRNEKLSFLWYILELLV